MSKPINIDAQRVISIISELKEKMTYMSVVTPQVNDALLSQQTTSSVADGEKVSVSDRMGAELIKKISDQIRLEEMYLLSNTNTDGQFAPTHFESEGDKDHDERLQKSTRELCRRMREVPNLVPDLRVGVVFNLLTSCSS
jgi:hypothetical protein